MAANDFLGRSATAHPGVILLLYGSMTGNSEVIAQALARDFAQIGVSTYLRDMADCEPRILTQAEFVLIVTSTYGNGEPPEEAVPFWRGVVHDARLDLRGIKFSVLALGNSSFDHFCQCGRDFDTALERQGARRITQRIDCDVDYEASAKVWFAKILSLFVGNQFRIGSRIIL